MINAKVAAQPFDGSAEETPPKNSGLLNGVQLWVALPDADRHGPASFQHIDEVPILEQAALSASLPALCLVTLLRQNMSQMFSELRLR